MAARGVISNKIVMEGEFEYRAALRAIGSEQKSLQSEMKLVTAEFDGQQNSMDALTKKHEVLARQLSVAGEKLAIYQKQYKEAAEARDKATENMDRAKKAYEDQAKVVEELAETQGESSEAYKEAVQELERLEKELDASTAGYYNAQRQASNFAQKQNEAERAVVELNHQLEDNDRYLEEAKNSADGCATSIDRYGKETREAREESEGFADSAKKADEALNAMSAILVSSGIAQGFSKIRQAMGECVEASEKFGFSMAKVQSVANVSSSELSNMSKQVRDFAVELGVSANDLAEGAYQAISAGVDASQAVEFAADATKLAIAGFTDASSAVDVVTTALNAYGMETSEATRIMDGLITTQNLGKITVNELAQGLGRVIPTASAFGVSFENVTSAIAEMTAKGVKSSESVTNLAAMLKELGDDGSSVAKILKENTGQSFAELMKSGKSLGDVLSVLYEEADRDKAAFINLWSQATAGTAAFSLAGDSGERFNSILVEMEQSAGATDTAFKTMADTSEMVSARFDSAVENFKISIGDALAPMIDGFKEMGIAALDALTAFADECPAVVAALGGLVVAVTGVVTVIGVAKAAMLAFNAVMAATPAGLVITGIAGVVGALVGLCSALDDSDDSIKRLADDFHTRNDEFKKTSDSFKTNVVEAQKLRDTIDKLQNKMDNYGKSLDLTTAEKIEMADAVAKLNELYPELGLEIDEVTGKLKNYSAAMAESLDAAVKQYEFQQNQEEINALIEKSAEDYRALQEAQEKWAEATKGMTANEVYNETHLYSGEVAELAELIWGELIPATEANEAAYDELTGKSKELKDEMSTMGDATGSAADGLNESAENVDEAANKISEATQKIVDSLKSSIEGIDPIFDQLSEKTENSAKKMTENLQNNAEVLGRWGENVKNVMSDSRYQTDENFKGMADMIIQKGPEAAGELANFANAAKENGAALEGLLNSFSLYSQALDESLQVIDNYGETVEGVGSEALTKRESFNSEMLGKQNEGQSEMEKSAETHKETMTTTATETPKAMADGITENAGLVTDACNTMLEEAQQAVEEKMSHDTWFGYGKKAMESLASGITKGSSAVSSAIKTCVQAAIDNADISGLAKKIDRALGASMTK